MSLTTLDYSYNGLPYCDITLVGDTYSLDYFFSGLPFVAERSYLCKILVSGAWKNVSEGYVLINGAWKSVSKLYVLVSGSWELNT